MKRVGLVGWRGMVGSVLMDRMQAERDFAHFEPVFFTTSNVGGSGPKIGGKETGKLLDAKSVDALQGHGRRSSPARAATTRTRSIRSFAPPAGRAIGSTRLRALRMKDDAVIILDPVNLHVIKDALAKRRQELHRRQLHGQPDADGPARPVQGGPGRVDDQHDVSGRQRGRGPEHARAAQANGRRQRQRAASNSPIRRRPFSKSTAAWPRRSAAPPIPPSISACRSPAA